MIVTLFNLDFYKFINENGGLPDMKLPDAFEEDRKAASECGMDGFISKPIDLKELIHVLNSVLFI